MAVVSEHHEESRRGNRETDNYLLKCNEENLEFKPFVLDSFGRMGDESDNNSRTIVQPTPTCQIAIEQGQKHLVKREKLYSDGEERAMGS
jgi:hypothetical protein